MLTASSLTHTFLTKAGEKFVESLMLVSNPKKSSFLTTRIVWVEEVMFTVDGTIDTSSIFTRIEYYGGKEKVQ